MTSIGCFHVWSIQKVFLSTQSHRHKDCTWVHWHFADGWVRWWIPCYCDSSWVSKLYAFPDSDLRSTSNKSATKATPPMLTSTSLKIDCFLPFSKSQTASESCDDSFAPWLTSSFQYGSRPTTHPHLTYDQCPSGLPVPSRVSPPTDYTSESWSLKSVTNMLLASI